MRILNREQFLEMPAGTVFVKFPKQISIDVIDLGLEHPILIKEDTIGFDFVVQELTPNFEGQTGPEFWCEQFAIMLKGGESVPLDYNYCGRDGCFDEDQLFLVWDRTDLERLIDRLNAALHSGTDNRS